MEDGKDSDQPPKQDGEIGEQSPGTARRNLKQAANLLKAEALRRYAQKHRGSLDKHEADIAKEFAQKNGRAKKSPSPGPNTPVIAEEQEEQAPEMDRGHPRSGRSSRGSRHMSTPVINEEQEDELNSDVQEPELLDLQKSEGSPVPVETEIEEDDPKIPGRKTPRTVSTNSPIAEEQDSQKSPQAVQEQEMEVSGSPVVSPKPKSPVEEEKSTPKVTPAQTYHSHAKSPPEYKPETKHDGKVQEAKSTGDIPSKELGRRPTPEHEPSPVVSVKSPPTDKSPRDPLHTPPPQPSTSLSPEPIKSSASTPRLDIDLDKDGRSRSRSSTSSSVSSGILAANQEADDIKDAANGEEGTPEQTEGQMEGQADDQQGQQAEVNAETEEQPAEQNMDGSTDKPVEEQVITGDNAPTEEEKPADAADKPTENQADSKPDEAVPPGEIKQKSDGEETPAQQETVDLEEKPSDGEEKPSVDTEKPPKADETAGQEKEPVEQPPSDETSDVKEEKPEEDKPAEDAKQDEATEGQETTADQGEKAPETAEKEDEKPLDTADASSLAQKEEGKEETQNEAGDENKAEDAKKDADEKNEEGQAPPPASAEAGQTTEGEAEQTEQGAQATATEDKAADVEGAGEGQTVVKEAKEEDGRKSAPADGQDPATRGDEDDIVSEQASVHDDAPKIPDDHYYDYEEHISKATVSDDSGLPGDMLTLHHSFGYDCQKRSNLHMLDPNTAIFAAGNVVQVVNLKTKEQTYLRSSSGGGIGALTVHPSKKYFAVAEKGDAPNINIIEYPSLKLYRILRGGTEKVYSYVDFSPDGRLLASVGGDPDYMLTQWDWKQEKIVLRSKAFSQDVFRVTFSTELEGQLTSSGTGHIRFWKMAKTFTGLKLQGQLGKFGKKEISDIEGYVELPDGKVLSGSEWGNMLLWDGGLIKVEISRKGKKSCHQGPIQQIIMDEGELMTIGVDGYIRVWDFETIDNADTTDAAEIFEMEPMNELKVDNDVQLRSIVKSVDEEEPTIWYAQDANGGIWKLDLSFSFTSSAPERLMAYHAGPIAACGTSPVSHLVATIGVDKTVRVYDYMTKEQLCYNKFNYPGSAMIWAPQTIDPKGATILTGFADGVVRVLNFQKKEELDVHGRKKTDSTELALQQAFKPHNNRVTSMAIDSKGEILATGGDDSTVFFLSIGANYEPIGFIKTPSPVTHLEWTPSKFKNNKLLVCCLEGEVMEVEGPDSENHDTTSSYKIEGLKIRTHNFKSVKSRLRHDEEVAKKAKEDEARRKKEEEERRIRIERGLETESDHGDDDDKKGDEEEEEEDWQPYIPEEPSPILYGFHSKDEGKFWLSMGEFDAGYMYECEFFDDAEKEAIPEEQLYEPGRTIPLHNSNDVPIRCMKFSSSGKHLIMGMEDGSIRIQPLHNEDVGLMGPFWSLNVHDNHYGEILHLATSFDDKYLFTVGADGNFFTFEFMDQEKIDQKIAAAKAKIPSAKKELLGKRIDDIEDPKAYSIEDAKQKSEYDKMMKLAEQKKQGVRSTISSLRDQFKNLLGKNHQLPSHLQLDKKEFEMDPEIKRELQRQTQEKVDHVNKEMAWEEEKHRVALEKLRSRFKDVVECERIIVKAFKTPHEVASFRTAILSDDFYMAKAEMEKRRTTMMSKDEASRQATQDMLLAQRTQSDMEGDGVAKEKTDTKIITTLKGSMGERITKALAKVEDKKRKRASRRKQWSELHEKKPDDDYEDPADLSAIKEAQENMGDYKLKSADDYVVPDHLRMNTDKARARLLLLKEKLHEHKYAFNQRLLALRDKKIHIIEQIRGHVQRLGEVQEKLGPEKSKPIPRIPEMHPEELPEKKYEYTRESLLKFKAEYEAKKAQAVKGVGGDGGFGGFGNAPPPAAADKASPSPPSTALRQTSTLTTERTMEPDWTMGLDNNVLSPLELKLKLAEEIKLLYERDRLLRDIEDLVKNFDGELRCLRHEKFKTDIDLKNADLRHVTLFEELLLLKDFEKREDVLAAKVEAKELEKHEQQQKVLDVQSKLEAKKKEIEKYVEKEKALNSTFVTSLGENNKFADYLMKVFKKKIKRSRKKTTEGEGSDDESDDDSDDESDWSESDEESDSEAGGYDLDVCPPGCDQNMYDNTCALREKRLDIEEALAEEKKNRDGYNKDLENLQKKAKVIDSGLKQAEQELEAFQLEKQRKLNELNIVVTLKLHQIQHINNGTLPQDLSQCLVFEAAETGRLQNRIKELEREKDSQKKQQKAAKKKHVQLIKDRRVFESRIGEMEGMTNKMMLQKFGRIVDLEKLETVTVNRQVEELKEKLRVNELACSSELTSWDEKIQDSKDNITQLIRENTDKLDQLNMLLGEKKSFESGLDARQKNLGSEFTGARRADIHERQRLIQLVHLQAQEIEALKEEIMLLSRKGGHILPPAQPPMPQSAQAARAMPNA